ncbi:MAG: HD-GYP domain-containing protein [Chloroflexota bacterium]
MHNNRPQILIIDDEPAARMTLEALLAREPYDLHFAENGIEGLAMASTLEPDVILCDVMMPNVSGFEVCRIIRSTDSLNEVPVLLITALDDRASKLTGFDAGADDYLTKPFDSMELLSRLRTVTRLNRYRRIAEQRREIEHLNADLLTAYDKTIEGWSNALDLRDKETEGHTLRVTQKTLVLARACSMSESELKQVWRGALLHDVGKLGIPDSILLKPGPLTDEEWTLMRLHPVYAYQWLSPIEYLSDSIQIPYSHHEKWDGSGYPRGLKGEQIPLAARLFAIIDVWDALTSDRPYRKAMSRDEAREYIIAQSGIHFDPACVQLFLDHIQEL